jgi:hypothetical protein
MTHSTLIMPWYSSLSPPSALEPAKGIPSDFDGAVHREGEYVHRGISERVLYRDPEAVQDLSGR